MIIIFIFIAIIINLDFKVISLNHEHTAKVLKVYNTSALVKEGGVKYYIMGVYIDLTPGDTITYTSNYSTSVNEIGSFDLFYKSTGADAFGWAKSIEVISTSSNIRNNLYRNLLSNDSIYCSNTLALLYGKETELNSDLLNTITVMGLSHLFVVSGFHISIFYLAIEKGMNKLINNRKVINAFSILSVLFFLYLIYFPLTGIRALLTLMIIRTYRFNKMDSLSIVGIMFFCINPYIMINNSMLLSFSITSSIYLIMPGKNNLRDTITISITSFYLALPTVATWNSDFNLLAPLLNILLTPVITFAYIISLVLLPFQFLWHIGDLFFVIFDFTMNIFGNIYIPIHIENSNMFIQYYLTITMLIYIISMRGHRLTLLNTFFAISMLLFII